MNAAREAGRPVVPLAPACGAARPGPARAGRAARRRSPPSTSRSSTRRHASPRSSCSRLGSLPSPRRERELATLESRSERCAELGDGGAGRGTADPAPARAPGRAGRRRGPTSTRPAAASRSPTSAPRSPIRPSRAGVLIDVPGEPRGRGARRDVRGRRRGHGAAHQAARDDAVAPGRDRVPGRQARARGRRPASPPRCARRTRRSGSSRTRSRSWPSSTRIGTVASAFTITPFVGLLAAVPELRPDPREVGRRVRGPDLGAAPSGRATARRPGTSGARPRPMAFFELPGETVWGATTARILTLGLLSGLAVTGPDPRRTGRERSRSGPEWDVNRPLG